VCSSDLQDEDKERAQQAGFDAHLTKPVELEALQALLAAGRLTPGLSQP